MDLAFSVSIYAPSHHGSKHPYVLILDPTCGPYDGQLRQIPVVLAPDYCAYTFTAWSPCPNGPVSPPFDRGVCGALPASTGDRPRFTTRQGKSARGRHHLSGARLAYVVFQAPCANIIKPEAQESREVEIHLLHLCHYPM
jgi:hypothetical protein